MKEKESPQVDEAVETETFDQLKKSGSNKELAALKLEVEQLTKKNFELEDLLKLQVASERNSLKRRDELEKDLRKYGAKDLGQLLVPELELLKKVLASLETNDNQELKNYLVGFEMVVKKMDNSLEEVGIKQIKLQPGDKFDEFTQEAVEQVSTKEFEPGTVVQIVSDGYMIHDRVLVHAKVKIAGQDDQKDTQKED